MRRCGTPTADGGSVARTVELFVGRVLMPRSVVECAKRVVRLGCGACGRGEERRSSKEGNPHRRFGPRSYVRAVRSVRSRCGLTRADARDPHMARMTCLSVECARVRALHGGRVRPVRKCGHARCSPPRRRACHARRISCHACAGAYARTLGRSGGTAADPSPETSGSGRSSRLRCTATGLYVLARIAPGSRHRIRL